MTTGCNGLLRTCSACSHYTGTVIEGLFLSQRKSMIVPSCAAGVMCRASGRWLSRKLAEMRSNVDNASDGKPRHCLYGGECPSVARLVSLWPILHLSTVGKHIGLLQFMPPATCPSRLKVPRLCLSKVFPIGQTAAFFNPLLDNPQENWGIPPSSFSRLGYILPSIH